MSPRKDPKIVGRVFWAWETAEAKAWTWLLRRGDQGRRWLGYQEASQGQAQCEGWGEASSSDPHSSERRGGGQQRGGQVITTQGLPVGVSGVGGSFMKDQGPYTPHGEYERKPEKGHLIPTMCHAR